MASRLQDVILRGTSAAKPAATTVAAGTLYYSTNTLLTERSNGTAWESYSDGGSGSTVASHAATHGSGGSDPVTIAESQVTNLITDLAGKASTSDPRFTDARTPTIHNTSHSSGGSDPVNLLNLAGYTSNINDVLRGNGTFGNPTSPTSIGCQWDGSGVVPITGIVRYIEVPFAHTITAAIMLADVAGSAVVDVWRVTYASAPPTGSATICASAKPTLASAVKSKDLSLAGWSKTGAAGDVYGFRLDSASVLTFVRVSLTVTRN